MTHDYAPEQVINRVASLTAERLTHFERLHIVTPITTPDGPRYRSLDVRRVTLLCELTDDFEVNEDALVIIMSLLDQLHGAHSKLEQVVRAIGEEPSETKARLSQHLQGARLPD
ncbi:MAG: chaperone modulatory protein CbpM [Halocynthiibacter sp.]|jgi:chaperone modulatory protein CbpM